jgi:hypothetical protein
LTGYRVTVEKALYRSSIAEVRGHNLSSVFYLYMGVKDTLRLNNNIWSLLAETMTAAKIYLGVFQPLPCHYGFERFIDSVASAGDASGALTNENSVFTLHVMPYPCG